MKRNTLIFLFVICFTLLLIGCEEDLPGDSYRYFNSDIKNGTIIKFTEINGDIFEMYLEKYMDGCNTEFVDDDFLYPQNLAKGVYEVSASEVVNISQEIPLYLLIENDVAVAYYQLSETIVGREVLGNEYLPQVIFSMNYLINKIDNQLTNLAPFKHCDEDFSQIDIITNSNKVTFPFKYRYVTTTDRSPEKDYVGYEKAEISISGEIFSGNFPPAEWPDNIIDTILLRSLK